MEKINDDTTLVDGYLQLLHNLSPHNKLDLISKLSTSVKIDINVKKSSFENAFGAFESTQTAEEIINDIRNSRISTRQIEEF